MYNDGIENALINVDVNERDNVVRHLISTDCILKDALAAINMLSGDVMTLFVVDSAGSVVGSLTDGDIRRALLRGIRLNDNVTEAMHCDFMSVTAGKDNFSSFREARARGLRMLPRLDSDRKIVKLLNLDAIRAMLPVDAVLMAGGRGERLRPLTLTTPKPLLEVGGKAIIDYNIEEMQRCGVENIFITVNYLREQIERHFENCPGIECIGEPKRMGTLGSLSLFADKLKHDRVFVMNSDLLTDLDFAEMYVHHIEHGDDITIAAVPYTVSVPYAIMETEGERVNALTEKPTFNYYTNAGVYLIRRELLARIERDTFVDAPDFIEAAISDGLRAGFFPIRGTWIDIGSPDDYRYACELMKAPALGKRR